VFVIISVRVAATELVSAARAMVGVNALRDNAARVDAVRAVFATRGVDDVVARVIALRDWVVMPVRGVSGWDAVRVRTWTDAGCRVLTDWVRGDSDVGVVLLSPRGDTTVRSRSVCGVFDFTDKFVARETDGVFDTVSDDFCRVTVTVFVGARRTAARAASALSSAAAPPNVSGARHTAKSNRSPFIPYM